MISSIPIDKLGFLSYDLIANMQMRNYETISCIQNGMTPKLSYKWR